MNQPGPQSDGQLPLVSPAMRSHTPSPHFGHARLHTMMSFGHCVWPEPPEHSLNVHDVAPVHSARHGEPPEQTSAQLVAS